MKWAALEALLDSMLFWASDPQDQTVSDLLARKPIVVRWSRLKVKVLDHPDIPLHTNASENDLRSFVTKRKISGGTMSRDGRIARDTMLGLMKTCKKLGLSFYHYLGDRLGLADSDQSIPPLATLVAARA